MRGLDYSIIEHFFDEADLHLSEVPESERRKEADAINLKVQSWLNRWRNANATPTPTVEELARRLACRVCDGRGCQRCQPGRFTPSDALPDFV